FGLKGASFAVSRAYFAISLLNVSRSVPSAGTAHASQTARTKKPRAILSMVESPLDRCRRSRSERHPRQLKKRCSREPCCCQEWGWKGTGDGALAETREIEHLSSFWIGTSRRSRTSAGRLR